ncbi:hypothetical protein [Microvirga makkahensis]|uniref:PsiF repeat-containing protein n=1 Tax=Microvirga makkahensis TaxID=1128670 RepID=A0A7X3MU20_9HYPH|nr:hypothetical protein [Microvirga makkahensis]MXQ13256.1 hypothetical protein [Microvirga makkahensis]
MNRLLSAALAATLVLAFTGASAAQAQTKPKKEPTAAQLAARERLAKCSAEWKQAKAGGKLEPGMKWPRFWSACNARIKGGTKA